MGKTDKTWMRIGGRSDHRLVWACGLLSTLTSMIGPRGALAQIDLIDEPLPRDARPNAVGEGIYLDDSFEAVDALARLAPLVRDTRWHEAAELLQGVSDQFGDKLIRREPGYYVGLRRYVTDVIAGWPRAGLDAYRSLFERAVDAALSRLEGASPGGSAGELALVDRYFCTRAAMKLAERLVQRAIESGDFSLAEHICRRMLDDHPDARDDPAHFRSLLAVAQALQNATDSGRGSSGAPRPSGAGQPEDAAASDRTKRPSMRQADAGARVRWKGNDRLLGEVLREIESSFLLPSSGAVASDWPVFGGNKERNRLARCSVDELGVQWRFEFDREESGLVEPVGLDSEDALAEYADALTIHPVVSGDLVLLQRHREIVALRRSTGEVVWRFGTEGGRSRSGDFIQERTAGWDAVTVANGLVYAAFPGEGNAYYGYATSQTPDEIVCLEAQTGRALWRASGHGPGSSSAAVQFDSSPLVEHGRLHVVGRRRRSFGFEDAYLFQFDARTGRMLSQTHVGSASTGTFGLQPATKAIAALHGDSVYVCSNLGSVAAISAYTGQVRWVRLYERAGRGDGARRGSNVTPWHYNPVMWTPEGLVVSPMDGDSVLILAPEDGRMVREIKLGDWGDNATILGLRGGTLCAAGDGVACFDVESGRTLWLSTRAEGSFPLGRAVWVDERLFVSMRSGIRVFDVQDGSHNEMPWDPEGEFGNLVALPEQLLVAGSGHVTSYVRKSEIWNALKERLKAAPHDPLPALELAEVAIRSGETVEALTALDVAVARATGGAAPATEAVRRRLFADALGFARLIADRGRLTPDVLDRLSFVASQFPTDAGEHLKYRLRFAALNRALERPELALKFYQQVLADRSLRALSVEPGEDRNVSAAGYCAARVSELIKEFGATLYESYETEAGRLLEAAERNQDEAMLGRVVEAFPNSKAAPMALVKRGSLLARRGRSTEALRYLIQAYHRYSSRVDKPDLLKRIADTLEWAGRRGDAYRWLTKASLEYPTAQIEDDGKQVTFAQYRNRLNDVREEVEPRRPRVSPPLFEDMRVTLAEPMSLLKPRFVEEPGMNVDRAFVYSDGGVQAIRPRSERGLWPEPLPVRESVDLLIARKDVVVFATSFEVLGAEPETGKRLWSYGTYPKTLDHPDGDWEDANAIRSFALRSHLLAVVHEDARVAMIDIRDGSQLWSDVLSPAPVAEVTLGDRLLAFPAVKDDRAVIGLADSLTGAWIDLIETDEHRPVHAIAQTLDGQILLVTSQTLAAYDIDQRSLRWRVSLGGHLPPGQYSLDLDAVYVSPDGRDVRKISLEDGRVLWEAVGLIGRDENDLTLERVGAQLLVSTQSSVVGVDTVTGMTLWRGTAPSKRNFEHRLITRDFLVAVNRGDDAGGDAQVFFYDLRNASGVIPEDGAPRVSRLGDLRRIVAIDGAILLQTDPTTIMGLSSQ